MREKTTIGAKCYKRSVNLHKAADNLHLGDSTAYKTSYFCLAFHVTYFCCVPFLNLPLLHLPNAFDVGFILGPH